MPELKSLKIEIDRGECIGDGACEVEAPETFFMDDDSIACVQDKIGDEFEAIMAAAEACPVDRIRLVDGQCEKQLYPENE
ncbi:MAG: ferredoxin [Planctomycetes bacterium]|nr:ferredoxin [Planctomycetota bacterium]